MLRLFRPVAVYAVAYLIQRSILGATLFVVLACLSFSKALLNGRAVWYLAALVSYVVAMLCKEHALMAPLLAVPLYVFLCRPTWCRIGFIVGACAVLVAGGIVVLLKFYDGIIGVAFDDLSKRLVEQIKEIDPRVEDRLWPLSILNQAALFFRYGLLWFVPNIQWMSVDLRPPFPVAMMSWQHLAGALAYGGLLAGAAWMVVRRSDPLGFAGLCLLFPSILFVTEFATVWIQDPFVLYRSYLWAISIPGLVLLLLTGLKPSTIYTAGLVIGLVFAGLALERVLSFKHLLSVWSDAAEKVNLDAPPNAVGRWRPFLNRGSYYLEYMLLELAYRDLTKAIELGEPQGSAQFNLGVALQLMERPAQALDAFTIAESMGFEQSGLYYHRAEIHYAQGDFVEAFNDYTEALARPQESAVREHTLMRRAEAAIPGRRFETAIEDFKLLLQRRPDDERLLMGLGMAYLGKQEPALAEPLFERLIADRSSATAYYGRALARHMLGKREDSVHDLDAAISLDPDNGLYQALRKQIAQQP